MCRDDDLLEGMCLAFTVQVAGVPREIFLVRKDRKVAAYHNSCPHTGGPLDWVPGQFLNIEGNLIQCATHDALFRIADGLCIAGPCLGDHLSPVSLSIEGGFIGFDAGKGNISGA